MIEELTLELEAQAVAAAKANGATHYDALNPLTYWRVVGHEVQKASYEDGRLVWQITWKDRIPEYCGVLR